MEITVLAKANSKLPDRQNPIEIGVDRCETIAMKYGSDNGNRGILTAGSQYIATASEDYKSENFCMPIVISKICRLVRLL